MQVGPTHDSSYTIEKGIYVCHLYLYQCVEQSPNNQTSICKIRRGEVDFSKNKTIRLERYVIYLLE